MSNSNESDEAGDEAIIHKGKAYTKITIEGKHDEEYFMDEDQNIYNLDMKHIGLCRNSDDEDYLE